MIDFSIITDILVTIGWIILAVIIIAILIAIFFPMARGFIGGFLTAIPGFILSYKEFIPIIIGALFLCIAIFIFEQDHATAAFSAGLGLILVGAGGTASIKHWAIGVITGGPGLILVIASLLM